MILSYILINPELKITLCLTLVLLLKFTRKDLLRSLKMRSFPRRKSIILANYLNCLIELVSLESKNLSCSWEYSKSIPLPQLCLNEEVLKNQAEYFLLFVCIIAAFVLWIFSWFLCAIPIMKEFQSCREKAYIHIVFVAKLVGI